MSDAYFQGAGATPPPVAAPPPVYNVTTLPPKPEEEQKTPWGHNPWNWATRSFKNVVTFGPLGPAEQALGWGWDKITTPFRLALLAANPNYNNQMGALWDLASFGHPELLGMGDIDTAKANRAAQDKMKVSTFQALESLPLVGFRGWLTSLSEVPEMVGIGGPYSEERGNKILHGYDPTDPEYQHWARETFAGKLATGAGDALISWFIAPEVLAAKGVVVASKPVRGVQAPTRGTEATVGRIAEEKGRVAAALTASTETQRIAAQNARRAAGNERRVARGLEPLPMIEAKPHPGLLTRIRTGQPVFSDHGMREFMSPERDGWSAVRWAQDPIVAQSANPSAFSHALAGTTGTERALVYRKAIGDGTADAALANLVPQASRILKNADGSVDAEKGALNAAVGGLPGGMAGGVENLGSSIGLIDDVSAAAARQPWLAAALSHDQSINGIITEYYVPRSGQMVKIRNSIGGAKYNMVGYRAQEFAEQVPGLPSLRVMRFVGLMGGKASRGTLSLDGNLEHTASEIVSFGNDAGMSRGEIESWVSQFGHAADETERLEVAERLDARGRELVGAEARDGEEANRILSGLTSVKRMKNRKEIEDSKGYMEHEDGNQSVHAEFETQLANSAPLTPLREYRAAIRRRNLDLKAHENMDGATAARWMRLGLKAADTGDLFLGSFYSLWKPVTLLFRGGYPGRNVAEANIASWIETQRFILLDTLPKGTYNWSVNRIDDLKRFASKRTNESIRMEAEHLIKSRLAEAVQHEEVVAQARQVREVEEAELARLTGRNGKEALADAERERDGHFAQSDQLEYDKQVYAEDAYRLETAEKQAREARVAAERELRRLTKAPRPPIPTTGSILRGEAREAQGELTAAQRADMAADEAAFAHGQNAPELTATAEGAATRTAEAEAAVPEIPAGDVAKYSEDFYRKYLGTQRSKATKLKKKMDSLPPELAADYRPMYDALLSDITDYEAMLQGYQAQLAPLRAAQKEARAELGRAKAAQTRAEAAAKKAKDPEERARLNDAADEALVRHDEARKASEAADEALANAKRDPSVAEHESRKAFLTQKITAAKKAEKRLEGQRATLEKRRAKLSTRQEKWNAKAEERAARDRRIQAIEQKAEELRTAEFWHGDEAQKARTLARIEQERLVKATPKPKDQTRRMVGTEDWEYRGYRVAGAFNAEHRAITRASASAAPTTAELNKMSESRRLNKDIAEARYRPTGRGTVKTTDPNYTATLTSHINNDFRTSEFLSRILRHESPEETLNWLLNEPAGRIIVKRMKWDVEDLPDRVLRANDMIDRYVPSEALRQLAIKGDVDEANVAAHLKAERLSDIHGAQVEELLEYDHGWDRMMESLNNFNQRMFELFGSMPEDAMARFPFVDAHYQDHMRRLIDANYERFGTMTNKEAEEAIRLFEAQSKKYALNQLKSTMFTIEQRYNLAASMRFVSPFLQVTMNRFGFYGRMALDRPVEMARLYLGYNGLQTHKNQWGDDVMTISLPGPVAEVFNVVSPIDMPDEGFSTDIPRHSLNLIGQGSPWWNPGFGPPVTVPVSALVRQSGTDPGWIAGDVLLSGYGAGENWKDQLIPSVPKKFAGVAEAAVHHGEDWHKNLALVMSQEGYRYKAGLRDKPTMGEMRNRAFMLTFLKFGQTVLSPIGGGPQINDPFAEQKMYLKQLRETDPDNASVMFNLKYPDMLEFMTSTMDNPYNIDASNAAIGRVKKYGDTLSAMTTAGADPGVIGMVVNAPDDDSFSDNAYTWQKQHGLTAADLPILTPQTWEDGHRRKQIQDGWSQYMAMDAQFDEILSRRGLKTLRDQGAEDLLAMRNVFVNRMTTENAPWTDDFRSSFDRGAPARNARAFAVALSDDRIQDDKSLGWTAPMSDYLMLRDEIGAILATRDAQGGSAAFDAVSNRDLYATWMVATDRLKASSPAFNDIFKRYFDNDNMLPMGATA